MAEYGLSLTLLFPYKDRIVASILVWKNTGQRKLALLYISHIEYMEYSDVKNRNRLWLISGLLS